MRKLSKIFNRKSNLNHQNRKLWKWKWSESSWKMKSIRMLRTKFNLKNKDQVSLSMICIRIPLRKRTSIFDLTKTLQKIPSQKRTQTPWRILRQKKLKLKHPLRDNETTLKTLLINLYPLKSFMWNDRFLIIWQSIINPQQDLQEYKLKSSIWNNLSSLK